MDSGTLRAGKPSSMTFNFYNDLIYCCRFVGVKHYKASGASLIK